MTETTAQGLYLAPPHGELIATGLKTAIAKGRPMGLAGEWILLSGGHAYGHMTVGRPEPVDVDAFKARRSEHGISEKERLRWWPERSPLYLYPVEGFQPYPNGPLKISLPPGVQTRVDTKGLGLPITGVETSIGKKAISLKAARWRTLKDGRHVAISGSGEKRGALTSRGSARVRDMERDISENKLETAIFTDVNGNVIHRQEGEEKQVEFTEDLLKSMKGKDAVMTHNHPLPYGLSGQDLVIAAYYDFAEIRAIAYDADTGDKKLYRMTRPEDGWGDWATGKAASPTWRTVEGVRSITESAVTRSRYRYRSRRLHVTKKKAIQDCWHEVGEAVAHMTNAEYVEEVVQ